MANSSPISRGCAAGLAETLLQESTICHYMKQGQPEKEVDEGADEVEMASAAFCTAPH